MSEQLCRHFDYDWIGSLRSLSPSRVNFSKTEKGIIGERYLLYAIDAARNVDLIKNVYKLGQPQKLSTAHQYPDLYCEGANFEYLFEMRNVFWYLGYPVGEDAFVNNLLGKVWSADEYPLEPFANIIQS